MVSYPPIIVQYLPFLIILYSVAVLLRASLSGKQVELGSCDGNPLQSHRLLNHDIQRFRQPYSYKDVSLLHGVTRLRLKG